MKGLNRVSATETSYVVRSPEGDWRLTNSRIPLDSIVYAYWAGLSPEAIADDYPTLSLEQIHGAIAFYLHHRAEIDAYMKTQADRWEDLRRVSETSNAQLLERVRNHRRKTLGKDDSARAHLAFWRTKTFATLLSLRHFGWSRR